MYWGEKTTQLNNYAHVRIIAITALAVQSIATQLLLHTVNYYSNKLQHTKFSATIETCLKMHLRVDLGHSFNIKQILTDSQSRVKCSTTYMLNAHTTVCWEPTLTQFPGFETLSDWF